MLYGYLLASLVVLSAVVVVEAAGQSFIPGGETCESLASQGLRPTFCDNTLGVDDTNYGPGTGNFSLTRSPVPRDDTIYTTVNQPVIAWLGHNDETFRLSARAFSSTTNQAEHGDWDVLYGAFIRYTPDDDYSGEDEFSYCLGPCTGSSNRATVTVIIVPHIRVSAVTDTVIDAVADLPAGHEIQTLDRPFASPVLPAAPGSDTLTLQTRVPVTGDTITDRELVGSVSHNFTHITYTPGRDTTLLSTGELYIRYVAGNSTSNQTLLTALIFRPESGGSLITPVAPPPLDLLRDDAATNNAVNSTVIDVLANDPSGFEITSVTQPRQGRTTGQPETYGIVIHNGTHITYTPGTLTRFLSDEYTTVGGTPGNLLTFDYTAGNRTHADTATVNVTIVVPPAEKDIRPPQSPLITLFDPVWVLDEGVLSALDIDATDDGGTGNLVYSLSGQPDGAAIDNNTGIISWMPREDQDGRYQFNVTVTDADDLSDTALIFATVREVNSLPVFDPIANITDATLNQPIMFTINANDTDIPAQRITYAFGHSRTGVPIDPSIQHLNLTVRVNTTGLNSTEIEELGLDGVLNLTINANSPDPRFDYTLNRNTGEFRWTPTERGPFDITVLAIDDYISTDRGAFIANGTAHHTFQIAVRANAEDDRVTVSTGVTTRLDVLANDDVGSNVDLHIVSGPQNGRASVSVNDIVYTSNDGYTGPDSLTYRVYTGPASDTATVNITVSPDVPGIPLIVVPPLPPSIYALLEYSVQLGITHMVGFDNHTFTLQGPLSDSPAPPQGTMITPDGRFGWTPAENQTGRHDITVWLIIDGSYSTSAKMSLNVLPGNEPPSLIPPVKSYTLDIGEVFFGIPYRFIFDDAHLASPTVTFSLDGAPAGMSVNPSNGRIDWTPSENGTYTFTLVASDGHLQDTMLITIVVLAPAEQPPPPPPPPPPPREPTLGSTVPIRQCTR